MFVNDDFFEKWMQKIFDGVREIIRNQKAQNGEKEVFGKGEKLMDNQDLCQMLHVSQRTLNRYRKSGSLPFFKRGQKIHYKASDVKKFVFDNGDNWDKQTFEAGM